MNIRILILNLIKRWNLLKGPLFKTINLLMLIISAFTFMIVVYEIGFDLHETVIKTIHHIYKFSFIIFFTGYSLRFIFPYERKVKKSFLVIRFFSLLLLFFVTYVEIQSRTWIVLHTYLLSFLSNLIVIHIILTTIFIVELSRYSLKIFKQNINPALLFIGSFIFLILVGTGLLLLPKSTVNGISFIDSLFTATSAVCVTGLTTVDTATQFTYAGKLYILILIQIGGLGVMTFTSFFGLFFMGGGSFSGNVYLKNFINTDSLSDIFISLVKIILITFIIEAVGAVFIFYNIDKSIFPNTVDNIGFSVFHSISAFCNAGFSTMTDGLYDVNLRYSYNIHLVVAFLIIVGGIGFPIIFNYYSLLKHVIKNKYKQLVYKQKYYHIPYIININSLIVIYATIILLFVGTGMFFITEYNNTLLNHSTLYGKLVTSFFASVTPRTAGFNTFDVGSFMPATLLFTIFLMWVGASSSSTAGGIKIGTFAIAMLNIYNFTRGKNRIEIMKREISQYSVSKAFTIIMLSIFVIGIAILLLIFLEPKMRILSIVFECFSAFGTVGLSMGITAKLTATSKFVLVIIMFLGRVGTLTFFLAFINKVNTLSYKYPTKNIIVG